MPSLSFLSYFNCCNQFLDSLLPLYCVAKQTWWILVKSNFPPTLSCIFFKFNILCWFLLFLPSSWWWVAHSIYAALPISMYFCCCYLFHAILPLNIILFISSHIAFKYILVHISIWDLFPDLHVQRSTHHLYLDIVLVIHLRTLSTKPAIWNFTH